jgi:transglutaminase-like putative cysteine protease
MMPTLVQAAEHSAEPRIESVDPVSAGVGALVTLRGLNFGASRESGAVLFAWAQEGGAAREGQAPETVEVNEGGCEYWSDHEIRVRVPDGAASGNVHVKTERGVSNPLFFELSRRIGSKVFKEKRSYTFTCAVNVQVQAAARPNALYLWVPKPVLSASQRGARVLSENRSPFAKDYRGVDIFQFADLAPRETKTVTRAFVADVYAVETALRPEAIRAGEDSPQARLYTGASPLVPADHREVRSLAAAITGRERNPYHKARLLYEWFLREAHLQAEPLDGGALEGLRERSCDSFRASLLFCALARASGIPAVPIAGVIVNRKQETSRHYWAEFWLDGAGWLPVDPAFGAGAVPDGFRPRDDHAAYYFCSIDNQRIAFSRGFAELSRMDPRGRVAGRPRDYALQSLWEEATGGLEAYSSLWSDVTITGVY